MKLTGRIDLLVLLVITLLLLGALVFTTLQLIDQSEQHVKDVTRVKVENRPVNEFFPRANECDLQVKADAERDPNRVEIRYNSFNLTEEGFKQLGRMRKLQRLWLIDCDAKDEWLKHLEKLPLNLLIVEGTDLTSDCIDHVAKIKTLGTLGLARNPITDDNLEKLATMPILSNLNLGETDITSAGIKKISKVSGLETLSVMGTHTTGESLADIAQLPKLYVLDFGQIPKVTPKQIRYLKNLKRLWRINMRRCDLTDECLKEFIPFPGLGQLEIDANDFTDHGLMYLKDCRGLNLVRLQNCKGLTPAGVERLRKAKSGAVIETKWVSSAGIDLSED
jgi:hypothetical protein